MQRFPRCYDCGELVHPIFDLVDFDEIHLCDECHAARVAATEEERPDDTPQHQS